MTNNPESVTVERELTPEGIALFQQMDASEQAIVRWLLTLHPTWPFNGQDVANMLLNGEHRAALQGAKP